MSKTKHITVVVAHIKVALEYGPETNLLQLTTQIKEQARKLTGFIDCKTHLGKIPAPPAAVVVVEAAKDDAAADLTVPATLRR